MSRPLVVIGGGGMGRCVLDVIDAVNLEAEPASSYEVLGVLDGGSPDLDLLSERGVPHLGGLAALEGLPSDVGYLIGIGASAVRARIDRALVASERPSPVLVHPNVHQGHGVRLGPGAVVCSHVSLENNIEVGRHVHLNQNCTIGHDTVIGAYATVSPLAAVSGSITVHDEVFVGTGASINQGLTVGGGSTIGAGAAVIADVAAGSTVVGVPARPVSR